MNKTILAPYNHFCHTDYMTAAETAISMTELTENERIELGHVLQPGHHALSRRGTSYLIDVSDDNGHKIADALSAFVSAASVQRIDQSDAVARLITAMTPPKTASRGVTVQAQRNAAARAALDEEFGLLSSAEVAAAAGARAKNTSSLASRWRKEARIFAVPGGDGANLYPAFQFDASGQPVPVIAGIIEALRVMDGWSLALWFIGANGWLGGERPADVLDDAQVLIAAQQLAAEIR